MASASSFNKNIRKRRLPILVMAWNLGGKIRKACFLQCKKNWTRKIWPRVDFKVWLWHPGHNRTPYGGQRMFAENVLLHHAVECVLRVKLKVPKSKLLSSLFWSTINIELLFLDNHFRCGPILLRSYSSMFSEDGASHRMFIHSLKLNMSSEYISRNIWNILLGR